MCPTANAVAIADRAAAIYWQDETYQDNRVLVHMPKGFDVRKPGVIVVFFHGNGATLERDVRDRQLVPQADFRVRA